jgi:hypothetical protein
LYAASSWLGEFGQISLGQKLSDLATNLVRREKEEDQKNIRIKEHAGISKAFDPSIPGEKCCKLITMLNDRKATS